jgi:hypothetical protein
MLFWLALVTLAGPAAADVAHAQQCVWIAQPAQERAAWFAGVRSAVEAEGVVVTVGSVDQALCEGEACVRALARGLGASRGVLVRVGMRGSSVAKVSIEVVSTQRASGWVNAAVGAAGVAAAVHDAYREAELALDLGDEGLLRVTTMPEAALVSLDGKPIGHAPFERRLAPGRYDLALSLDGFVGQQREITIARGRVYEAAMRLARAPGGSARVTHRERSPLNYILGGVLVAASVPALGSSIRTLALDGDCAARQPPGACTERVHFGARSGALFALGAAALIGGVVIMVAAPFTIAVDAEPGAARVALTTRF